MSPQEELLIEIANRVIELVSARDVLKAQRMKVLVAEITKPPASSAPKATEPESTPSSAS